MKQRAKAWKGIGRGKFDNYCMDLLKQLLPNLKRKYDIAEHTFTFLLKHKIKGCEVDYYTWQKISKETLSVICIIAYCTIDANKNKLSVLFSLILLALFAFSLITPCCLYVSMT